MKWYRVGRMEYGYFLGRATGCRAFKGAAVGGKNFDVVI